MADNGNEMEEVLQEREDKIVSLERTRMRQDEQIILLRQEIAELDVKHKEELYWLRLEVDTMHREKEGVEDRVSELYRDLRELETTEFPVDMPANLDPAFVMNLQTQVQKSMQHVGILNNQINMVKSSCDEVVKSLKEEIGDVMDDKCRMEMDLLNQLAVLDNEKRELEAHFDDQMEAKEELIAKLKSGVGVRSEKSVASEDNDDREELLTEIDELKESLKKAEDKLASEIKESDNAIERLEEANGDLEQQIEAMTSDLEVMREGAAAEAVEVLDTLTKDRQETLTTLERVAMIWEKADDSIQGLEDIMDELRPQEDDVVHSDRERLLSTLETASLVHGQIKVTLLLVELKLRNQLSSLKNDKLRMGPGSMLPDENLTERMIEIQKEALTALDQVEDSLTLQIKQLEQATRDEASQVKDHLEQRTEELKNMQSQQRSLEAEIARLRREEESKKQNAGEKAVENNGGADLVVSKSVLEKLQKEVLVIVERVKEKNETIGRLTSFVEEHKVREAALKKELKRMMKKSRTAEEEKDSNGSSHQRASRRSSNLR